MFLQNPVSLWFQEVITHTITKAQKLFEGVNADNMNNGHSCLKHQGGVSGMFSHCLCRPTMITSGEAKPVQCKTRLLHLLVCQPRQETEDWLLSWWQKYQCSMLDWKLYVSGYKVTRQIWGIWKLRPAYSPETPNLGKNRWYFVPCDHEIWWITLENNRASLLCCFKLCATFHSHWWIQTGVTFRKRPIWVKIDDFFLAVWPCNLMYDLEKQ